MIFTDSQCRHKIVIIKKRCKASLRSWEQFLSKNVGFLSRKYICQDLRKWVGRVGHLLTQIYNTKAYVCLSVCPRVGKTESLGLWRKVIVYCLKLSSRQNDRPMGQSFLQKESLLQYTMNLLKGPKDPSVHMFWKKKYSFLPIPKGQENGYRSSIFVSTLRKTSKVIKLLAHPNSRSLCRS